MFKYLISAGTETQIYESQTELAIDSFLVLNGVRWRVRKEVKMKQRSKK